MVLGLNGYDIGEGIFFLSRLKDYLLTTSPGQDMFIIIVSGLCNYEITTKPRKE
jgi:hypothetical protein